MASIRELTVSLGFEFDQQSLDKIDKGIADLKTGLLAVGAAAIGASATLFAFAKGTADSANEIARTANELGLTTAEFQKLGFLAESSGASVEDMTGGLRSLLQAMNAARLGSGNQADAFRRLGIQIKDQTGQLLPLNAVYGQLTSAISKMGAGSKRTAIATDILGGSASKMLTVLEKGNGAISAAGEELESFGGIIDEAGFKKTLEFQQSLARLTAQFKAIVRTIGLAVVPIVGKAVSELQKWITTNRELIKTRILFFTDALTTFLKRLFIVGRSVVSVMTALFSGVERLAEPFGGLAKILTVVAAAFGLYTGGRLLLALGNIAQGVLGIAGAFNIVNLKALAIPILLAAAAAAIYLIVDDIVAFVEGRPSFLGYLVKNKDKILSQIVEFFKRVQKFVLDVVQKSTQAFFQFFGVPKEQAELAALAIRNAFEGAMNFTTSLIGLFVQNIKVALTVVAGVVSSIALLITDLINKPIETLAEIGPRIAKIFGDAGRALIAGAGEIFKSISQLFNLDGAKFDKFWIGFKTSAFAVIGIVQGQLATVFSGLATAAVTAGQTVFDFVASLIQVIASLITEPTRALEGFKDAALKFLPEGVVSFFNAQAAPATPAEQAQLTGARQPPTELPTFVQTSDLVNQSNMLQGSTTVNLQNTVNVTAPTDSDASDVAEQVRRATEESFKNALRQSGTVVQPAINY